MAAGSGIGSVRTSPQFRQITVRKGPPSRSRPLTRVASCESQRLQAEAERSTSSDVGAAGGLVMVPARACRDRLAACREDHRRRWRRVGPLEGGGAVERRIGERQGGGVARLRRRCETFLSVSRVRHLHAGCGDALRSNAAAPAPASGDGLAHCGLPCLTPMEASDSVFLYGS